jgi:hypothetical protein
MAHDFLLRNVKEIIEKGEDITQLDRGSEK